MKKKVNKGSKLRTVYLAFTAMIALFILVVATYAWFANNRSVDANLMKVESHTTPNVVIKTSAEEIDNIGTVAENDFHVYFNEVTGSALNAVTHDSEYSVYATGLKYNSNPEYVSVTSGTGSGITGLTFEAASDNGKFFRDYKVYIASADMALTGSSIDVTLSTSGSALEANDYRLAASVDFYAATLTSGSTTAVTASSDCYKGTLNLAGIDNSGAAKTSVNIISNYEIPQIDSSHAGYVEVLMRVYFDGALSNNGTCYVRSSNLNTDNVNITANFKATSSFDATQK